MNRNKYIWCIDNLYKKFYVGRYNFIKKKYGIIKNENLDLIGILKNVIL